MGLKIKLIHYFFTKLFKSGISMSKFIKMKRPRRMDDRKKLFDICSSVVFTVFVFSFFLFMFTYADNLSHVRERYFREKLTFRVSQNEDFRLKNYTWECRNSQCMKVVSSNNKQTSLNTCNMLCSTPQIWPQPRNITFINKQETVINIKNIFFNLSSQVLGQMMLKNATHLFMKKLESLKSGKQSPSDGLRLNVTIILRFPDVVKLKLNTDESYKLSVRKNSDVLLVNILASNFFGARHGLETLSQLIWFDEVWKQFKILHDVDIQDAPFFPHRGVMVDTARNFFPLHQLKKVIDGMAMSKLNVLHLHLTDATSFPIILPRIKELAEYGAYGPDMVYTPQDIKDLLKYGRVRGVRLLLEIDAPSHVNAGWNYAEEMFGEKYVICGESDFFNGHLNPDNENVLNVIEYIYRDLLYLSDESEIFHIGSDEVNLSCWEKTAAAKNVIDMKDFWVDYTNQMLLKLKNANNDKYPDNIIIWSSPLTNSRQFRRLNGNITVQFWLGNPNNFLESGSSVIYSTVGHWYLDCGFGPWKPSMTNGVCDPYTPWQTFYEYRPWIEHGHRKQALGGEVCLWSEQVDVDTVETRIWPRSAAFAERVWSDPEIFDNYDVYTRLTTFRERLMKNGIKTAAMWPKWCSQNPGKC